MLSQTALVMVRNSIELSYSGLCDIFEFNEVLNVDKTTTFTEVLVHNQIPCKLSFSNSSISKDTEIASGIAQNVKLFLAPEIIVNSGSKIIITQDNTTTIYENSGQPSIFPTHQEISLRLFKEWS